MAKKTIVLSQMVKTIGGLSAAAAITPGHLIEETSAGKLQKHSTAGGYALPVFAIEDTNQGTGIDSDYAVGEEVQTRIFQAGDVVNAFIQAGVDVARGEKLISAGDGTLIGVGDAASGVTVSDVVGYAKEALDLTASGAVASRVAVVIL